MPKRNFWNSLVGVYYDYYYYYYYYNYYYRRLPTHAQT